MEHKTSETTSIFDVWRNLKQVEINIFGDKDRGGIRFGSKGWEQKIYNTQKNNFFLMDGGGTSVIIRPRLRHDYSLPVHRNDRIRKK